VTSSVLFLLSVTCQGGLGWGRIIGFSMGMEEEFLRDGLNVLSYLGKIC
jgi:hypothetical protein